MSVIEDVEDQTPVSKPASGEFLLADTLEDLYKNALDFARSQIRLAAAETSWKITRESKSFQLMALGVSIACAGFLLILTAAVIALSAIMPAVWAALILGGTVLVTGTITVRTAQKRLRREEHFIPRQVIASLREDAKWVRDQFT